jgi:hypothetical protein
MGKWSNYDVEENIVYTDITGVENSMQSVDNVIDEVIGLVRDLPEKPYLIVCWRDVSMDPDVADYYGKRTADLIRNYLKGVARYAATDIATRIHLRTETIKHHTQGSRSHIYNTKEEALEAIRNGEIG